MKKSISFILFAIAALFLFNSCRKDYANEHYTETVTPITPDFTVKILANVSGFVTDSMSDPIGRASVTVGDKSVATDEFGYFSIKDVLVPETAGVVKISAVKSVTIYKTFIPQKEGTTFLQVRLFQKRESGTFNSTTGGTFKYGDGTAVTLPANSVVIASSGAAYTGTVHVFTGSVDLLNAKKVLQMSPGDSRAIDSAGHLKTLNPYHIIEVELTGDGGQLLQIAPGRKATLDLAVPSALMASAPVDIPLWYFNTANGMWKQEGTAKRSGNLYTGTVSHFSFWSVADAVSMVQLSVRLVSPSLQPLANVAVGIRHAGSPFNSGYGRYGITDANGNVYGAVPANSQLILNVMTPCETEAYSHNFSTAGSNIDLGVLTGNLGQGMVTISGNAVNCNNQPITNGYVQAYDNGFFHRIDIVNGAFSFTGVACTGSSTPYVAIDEDTHQQGSPGSVLLKAGTNNLGTLTACGTSTMGSLIYTIDGFTRTITEPTDTLRGYFNEAVNSVTLIRLTARADSVKNFELRSDMGSGYNVIEFFANDFPGGRGVAPVPLKVTLTSFGQPGGFITGSFGGVMLDFASNGIHNVSCEFRIRRYQ